MERPSSSFLRGHRMSFHLFQAFYHYHYKQRWDALYRWESIFITVETNTLAALASKSSLERDDDMLDCIGRWLPLNDNYIPVQCIVV